MRQVPGSYEVRRNPSQVFPFDFVTAFFDNLSFEQKCGAPLNWLLVCSSVHLSSVKSLLVNCTGEDGLKRLKGS